jgi:hypothetical protein
MTSQLFTFETRPSRTNFSDRPQTRGYASGWLFLVALTLAFSVWLTYRWFKLPGWPESLPDSIAELLRLAELATALTLAILWAGLIWRRRARLAASRSGALTVDQMYALSPKAFEHYVASLFR